VLAPRKVPLVEAELAALVEAGRPLLARADLPRVGVDGYGLVMERKQRIPTELPGITSLRDFGGCYLVHGRYLLGPTRDRGLGFASMIDGNITDEFRAAVDALRPVCPGTTFEIVEGDFRDPDLYQRLPATDAALLYEVLLHQENYVEVVHRVCQVTDRYVCVAQPNLREELFTLPASAALLQFYDEPLKDLLREGTFWPAEPPVDRFTTSHWMWGLTTSHLVEVFRGFGWRLAAGEIVENVCGRWWEYPLLVFERSRDAR
jgi:hypothetical protein